MTVASIASAALCLVLAMTTPETSAFQGPLHTGAASAKTARGATPATSQEGASSGASKQLDPLLIRAARGEKTERTPVWMMRQAGRHIKEYRDLCKEYPTFRQRSEIAEVAVEISLQPWRNYQTDGCILFSDILTPLPGMGCEFVIDEKVGPLMSEPIRSWDDMKKVRTVT
jgi:uroporphyrinogen decarboxylase